MIYNTRNRRNDTTESQKESMEVKVKLDCTIYSKQTNKMWSLKSLLILQCESRVSLHAVQYK